MQQLVRFVGQRRLHIGLIKRLNVRVFVGKTQLRLAIQAIQSFAACESAFFSVVNRLPAAADTAAGASHHFHKIILHLAAFNAVQQRTGITQSADHSGTHLCAAHREHRLCHAGFLILGANHAELIRRGILACYQEMCRAQSRFHNAAGCTENDTGTRTGLHQTVTCTRFERRRHNMR